MENRVNKFAVYESRKSRMRVRGHGGMSSFDKTVVAILSRWRASNVPLQSPCCRYKGEVQTVSTGRNGHSRIEERYS